MEYSRSAYCRSRLIAALSLLQKVIVVLERDRGLPQSAGKSSGDERFGCHRCQSLRISAHNSLFELNLDPRMGHLKQKLVFLVMVFGGLELFRYAFNSRSRICFGKLGP